MQTTTSPAANVRYLGIREVASRVGASRGSLYNWMKSGDFPKSRRLGPRRVGWLEHEVSEWLTTRTTAAA